MQKLDPTKGGIDSVRLALSESLDPAHGTAYNRVFGEPGEKYEDSSAPNFPVEGVIKQLIQNQNEIIDTLNSRPF